MASMQGSGITTSNYINNSRNTRSAPELRYAFATHFGCGTAGLCAAYHSIKNNIVPTIFEQCSSLSGTWLYSPDTSNPKNWEEVHTSMYEGLRTNLPKEIMGFPNFSILNVKESYVSSNDIQKFLEDYAKHFGLRKYLNLSHKVLRIHPKNKKWQVTVINLQNKSIETHTFHYVMNCSGHYHTPLYPNLEGRCNYMGIQIHSHDFRNTSKCIDKCVLIIGAGPSGMDLCHKISEVTLQTFLSHTLKEVPETEFSKNVVLKGRISKFNKYGGFFQDGSYEIFDYIVYCTGFKFSYPYINMDCKSYIKDNYVRYLYKQCMNSYFPTMSFIGIPFYVCFGQMVDLQNRFINTFLKEIKKLPNIEDIECGRKEELKFKYINGCSKHQAHMLGPWQNLYFIDLSRTSDTKGVEQVYTRLHNESSQQFLDNLTSFRMEEFKIIDSTVFIKTN